MLELLVKYAHDHGLVVEPGFKTKDVRWAIVCDEKGNFLDVLELGDAAQKNNRGRTFLWCPEMDRGRLQAGGKSHFLVETAAVIALYGQGADAEKIHQKHRYFIDLLRAASDAMPELKLLLALLGHEGAMGAIRERLANQKAKPTDSMTFRIGDSFPVDLPTWHPWWRSFREALSAGEGEGPTVSRKTAVSGTMRCFVGGELAEPVLTHSKIEGLASVGGRPSGDALICFDKEAFQSYGLEQSANAAVSEEAASAYRAALNHLIRHRSRNLAGTKVVHWFKCQVPVEDDPLPWLEEGGDEEESAQHLAEKLLTTIRNGERPDLAANHFYALTLSGAAGRVMVRDFMEGPFEDLASSIHAWFDDLAIVHREGGRPAPDPKFLAVLGATVRDLKDVPPPRATKLWRVAVRNESIPADVLAQALSRTKMDVLAGGALNHARMSLLKSYHIRQARQKGGNAVPSELTPYLNEKHPSPAYQCGRLMALLAGLQRAALGDVGAGVVQRYYAAAGTTPALVFGRLTRLSQFHLSKLDPGLAYWYESKIAGIWGHLRDALPATLSLEEQSLFALGYYQQLAEMRTKKPKEVAHEPTDSE